ncbi:acetyl-CoA carboxylase biotin carboxyl carrier protein subunit [Bacillus sp. AGMB 02131]|uniref:Acetyl-CoA carboxylase biotin carboxyl carrier protein subunit n=1 Tax=Peribacillus faecalis TaxID=2772559 RepID=A0A927CZQ3_9BACI|nr:acetyl-CoA carboxylase biotin carboxyl carrier protein subunit [Peribacillus faecalis]MBD3108910.1 acetyl-CoA carboxylase biotin carboxyl carrier protein subunit [Peribacillus faecalis]
MSIEVRAQMTGSIWKITAEVEQKVEEDQEVLILESMKMEIPITAPETGTVKEILVAEGDFVTEGDVVMIIEEE